MQTFNDVQIEVILRGRSEGKSWKNIALSMPGRGRSHLSIRAYAVAKLGMEVYLPGCTVPSPTSGNAMREARKAATPPSFDIRPPMPAGDPVSWGAISGEVWAW